MTSLTSSEKANWDLSEGSRAQGRDPRDSAVAAASWKSRGEAAWLTPGVQPHLPPQAP